MEKIKLITGVIGNGKGGMSRFAVDLFKRLDPDHFDVTFLSNSPTPYFGPEIEAHGGHIEYIAARGSNPAQHKKDLKRIMESGGYDVCHIHLSSASNIEPLIAAKKAGVPLVIAHAHAASVEGGLPAKLLHRLNSPKIRKYTDKRLACSRLAGEFMYHGADFMVIKNAIDLERFCYRPAVRAQMREKLALGDAFTVGHIGRMAPSKNPTFLLETFAALLKLQPESRFVYVGDGPLEEEIHAKAQELGIENQIVYAGMVSNPEDYLCAFDCFLLPSLHEGLGFVAIEAVCAGLRCFVSDAIPEEARVGEMVESFPLSIPKEELARRMLREKDSAAVRTGQKELLARYGYDTASQKKQMEAIYMRKM